MPPATMPPATMPPAMLEVDAATAVDEAGRPREEEPQEAELDAKAEPAGAMVVDEAEAEARVAALRAAARAAAATEVVETEVAAAAAGTLASAPGRVTTQMPPGPPTPTDIAPTATTASLDTVAQAADAAPGAIGTEAPAVAAELAAAEPAATSSGAGAASGTGAPPPPGAFAPGAPDATATEAAAAGGDTAAPQAVEAAGTADDPSTLAVGPPSLPDGGVPLKTTRTTFGDKDDEDEENDIEKGAQAKELAAAAAAVEAVELDETPEQKAVRVAAETAEAAKAKAEADVAEAFEIAKAEETAAAEAETERLRLEEEAKAAEEKQAADLAAAEQARVEAEEAAKAAEEAAEEAAKVAEEAAKAAEEKRIADEAAAAVRAAEEAQLAAEAAERWRQRKEEMTALVEAHARPVGYGAGSLLGLGLSLRLVLRSPSLQVGLAAAAAHALLLPATGPHLAATAAAGWQYTADGGAPGTCMPLGELAPPNLTRTHVLPLLEYMGAASPAEAPVATAAPTDGDDDGDASTVAEPAAAWAGATACTPVCALLQAPLLALWWRLFPAGEAEGLAAARLLALLKGLLVAAALHVYEPLKGGGAKALARLLLLLLLLLDGDHSHHAHAHDGAAHEGSCALALALTPAATILLCGLLRRRKHIAAAVALGGMVAARPALAYAAPLLLVHLLASEGFGAPKRKAKADDDTAGGSVRGGSNDSAEAVGCTYGATTARQRGGRGGAPPAGRFAALGGGDAGPGGMGDGAPREEQRALRPLGLAMVLLGSCLLPLVSLAPYLLLHPGAEVMGAWRSLLPQWGAAPPSALVAAAVSPARRPLPGGQLSDLVAPQLLSLGEEPAVLGLEPRTLLGLGAVLLLMLLPLLRTARRPHPTAAMVAWALLAGSIGLFAGHLPLARLAHEQLLTLLLLLAPAGLPYARAFLLIDGGSRAAAAAHLAAATASHPAALLAAVQAAFAVGVAYAALHRALCAPRAATTTAAGGRLLLPTLWKLYLLVLPLEVLSPTLATARAVGAAALAVCLLGLQHGTAAEAEAEEEAAEAEAAATPRLAAAGGGADADGSAASEGQAQLQRAWAEAHERADGLEISLREAQAALAQQQQQMQMQQQAQMQPQPGAGADAWRQHQQPLQPQPLAPPRPAVVPTQAYSPPPPPPTTAGGVAPADSPPPFGAPTPLPCSLGAMSDSMPQEEGNDADPDRTRHAGGTPFVLSRQPAAGLPMEATRLPSPPIPGRPPPLISPGAEGFDGDDNGAGPMMSSPPKGPMVPKMRGGGAVQAPPAGRPTTPRRSMMGSVVPFDNTNQTRRSTTPRRC